MAPDVASQFLAFGNSVPATFTKAGQAVVNEMHGNKAGNVEFQSFFCSKSQRKQRIEMAVKAVKSQFPKKKFVSHIYEQDLPPAVSRYSQQSATGYSLAVDTSGLSEKPIRHSYAKNAPRVLVLGGRGLLDAATSVLSSQIPPESLHSGTITDDNGATLESSLGHDWGVVRAEKKSTSIVRLEVKWFEDGEADPIKWADFFAVKDSKGLVVMAEKLKDTTSVGLSLDDFDTVYLLTEKRLGDVGVYEDLDEGELLQFTPKTGKHRKLVRIVPE
jgi:hypothetical protein